jgi:hypothetical protein
VQSFSNRRAPFVILTALLLACCSTPAPPLPPDTTSINRTRDLTLDDFTPEARVMTCEQIADERRQIADRMSKANDVIASNRSRDEAAMFAALLIAPIAYGGMAAAGSNGPERTENAKLYERRDTLIKLATLKHCPAAIP